MRIKRIANVFSPKKKWIRKFVPYLLAIISLVRFSKIMPANMMMPKTNALKKIPVTNSVQFVHLLSFISVGRKKFLQQFS